MKIQITELPKFEELNSTQASTITGGLEVSRSIKLSPQAASFLWGKSLPANSQGIYTVTYEDGELSDFLQVITFTSDGNVLVPFVGKGGIFFKRRS
ncbi:MAG: hypothetical protein Tsb0014_08090 [Pleurocapsa sp.]